MPKKKPGRHSRNSGCRCTYCRKTRIYFRYYSIKRISRETNMTPATIYHRVKKLGLLPARIVPSTYGGKPGAFYSQEDFIKIKNYEKRTGKRGNNGKRNI